MMQSNDADSLPIQTIRAQRAALEQQQAQTTVQLAQAKQRYDILCALEQQLIGAIEVCTRLLAGAALPPLAAEAVRLPTPLHDDEAGAA